MRFVTRDMVVAAIFGITSIFFNDASHAEENLILASQPESETSQDFLDTELGEGNADGAVFASQADAEREQRLAALHKAAASPYKTMFWNNDFDYLEDPLYSQWHLGETLKRIPIGESAKLDIGGAYRLRYHNEHNMAQLGLTGLDDQFILHRTRLYANLEFRDWFRFYFEGMDAVSELEDTPPRGNAEDRAALWNLFGDFLLLSCDCGDLSVRVGRQEMIFGAGRLIAPLRWGNVGRTFQGVSAAWKGENVDSTFFWTNPVEVDPFAGNGPDRSRDFWGFHSTLHAYENSTTDLFFYRLVRDSGATFDVNTFGGRFEGERGPWACEIWGAGQFGDVGAASQSAWACSTGLARTFSMPGSPTLWAYFDYATGDADGNGFNQLFPLGHKYMGFMDFFARRNLQDVNFQLTMKPADRVKCLMWWHIFSLQNANDVPYNINLTPFAATAGGDRDLGQELDLVTQITLTERSNLILGYSHFFTGDWYRTNPSPPVFDGDADFFYSQYVVTF